MAGIEKETTMRLIDADSIQEELAVMILYLAGTPKGECIEYAHDLIDAQPTIDATPVKHGVWFGTVCSCCGASTSFSYDCEYCPHCGADMRGEDDENR